MKFYQETVVLGVAAIVSMVIIVVTLLGGFQTDLSATVDHNIPKPLIEVRP